MTPKKKKPPKDTGDPWPDRLRALRDALGLTQAEAADRVKAPVGTWRGWEYGRREPSAMIALLLEMAFPEFDFARKRKKPG